MNTSKRYSPEVREGTVRMVLEQEKEYCSQWPAIESISEKCVFRWETDESQPQVTDLAERSLAQRIRETGGLPRPPDRALPVRMSQHAHTLLLWCGGRTLSAMSASCRMPFATS